MDASSIFSRLPVLRLLLPLIVGILLHDLLPHFWLPVVLVALTLLALIILKIKKKNPSVSLSIRKYHIIPLFLAMTAVGWIAAWIAAPPTVDVKKVNGIVATGRIESIEYNEKSMSMLLNMLNPSDVKSPVRFYDTHIILSTRGCDYDLKTGDLVEFTLELDEITNLGNPDEMDYAKYMYRKGIRYRQHTDINNVKKVGVSLTLMTRAYDLRQNLQHKVMGSRMSPDTQSLIIAMLLGNSDFISRETRDIFSQAGVAHVLALSGLHVAIIAFMIWFLLFPLDYLRARRLRLIITILILIAYDIVTGLSPSVVRATVMLSFVFMSMILYRKSTPLNSLFSAALAILVFSPSSLFGAGFQLSFITVAALIIFYGNFNVKYPDNKFLKYLYTTLLTSLVAMLSTIILTAYYFNTVSLSSALSNVVIMPILPVFMLLGALALFFLSAGVDALFIDKALNAMSSAMNGTIGWFASLPLSQDDVYVTWVAVVVYYIALILISLWIYRKKMSFLLAAGVVLILGIIHGIYVDWKTPRNGLVVFNSYNSTPVFYFYDHNAMLWVPDVENDFDLKTFKRQHRAFLAHHRIDSISLVDSTKMELPDGIVEHPCAKLNGVGMIAAGKGRWKHYEPSDSNLVKFDCILVTKGFHSDISTLKSLFSYDKIILSGGIYGEDNKALEKECENHRIPHYNIKTSGAYIKMGK
ncbi:MAG: ComEC/Rec2 family competence protein [Muribaculaceae bacterium]|nr:ComEC/Rec2 family competence protein [Muribaculaceae bacterium]